MATLQDFRDERIRKLNELKEAGIDPYPAHSNRDTKIKDILEDFDKFAGKQVCVEIEHLTGPCLS